MATDERCMKEANDDAETDDGRMEVFEAVPQKFELSRNLHEIEDASPTQQRNALGSFSVTRE